MIRYEEVEPIFDGGPAFIKRINEDVTETFIPLDKRNSDYQAYLAYLAEQETAK